MGKNNVWYPSFLCSRNCGLQIGSTCYHIKNQHLLLPTSMDCHPVISNCKYVARIHGDTTNWHCNWRLLQKIELGVIAVRLTFTYIYLILCCPYVRWFYRETIPVYWRLMEAPPPYTSSQLGYYPRVLNIISSWGVYIRGYGSISGMNAVWLQSLPSYVRLPLLSGIPFFEPFWELLCSEFPKQTPEANPLGICLLLLWHQCMICSKYWTCLAVHMHVS